MRRSHCARLACLLGVLCVAGSGCATGGDDNTDLYEPPGADGGGADTSAPQPDSGAPYDSGYVPPYDSGYVPPYDSGYVPPADSGSPPPFDSGNPPPPEDSGMTTGQFCDESSSSNAAKYFAEWTLEEAAGTAVPCTDNSTCSSGDCCYMEGMACVPQ